MTQFVITTQWKKSGKNIVIICVFGFKHEYILNILFPQEFKIDCLIVHSISTVSLQLVNKCSMKLMFIVSYLHSLHDFVKLSLYSLQIMCMLAPQ